MRPTAGLGDGGRSQEGEVSSSGDGDSDSSKRRAVCVLPAGTSVLMIAT
jgi:hypothetical protein